MLDCCYTSKQMFTRSLTISASVGSVIVLSLLAQMLVKRFKWIQLPSGTSFNTREEIFTLASPSKLKTTFHFAISED